jgi:TRAP-type mannitol/chloroaromatic compound transport system substrate-binding protein
MEWFPCALVAAGAASVVDAPHVIAQTKVQWRMPTMWPPSLDILQGNAQKFAKIVDELTGGTSRSRCSPAES